MIPFSPSLGTSADLSEGELRDSLGLVRTTPDSVYHVTDETTCLAARAAFDKVMGTPPQPRSVYVFVVGSLLAVIDPFTLRGEWTPLAFFTREWEYVSSVGR